MAQLSIAITCRTVNSLPGADKQNVFIVDPRFIFYKLSSFVDSCRNIGRLGCLFEKLWLFVLENKNSRMKIETYFAFYNIFFNISEDFLVEVIDSLRGLKAIQADFSTLTPNLIESWGACWFWQSEAKFRCKLTSNCTSWKTLTSFLISSPTLKTRLKSH